MNTPDQPPVLQPASHKFRLGWKTRLLITLMWLGFGGVALVPVIQVSRHLLTTSSHYFAMPEASDALNEEFALEKAREALSHDGYDAAQWHPRRYLDEQGRQREHRWGSKDSFVFHMTNSVMGMRIVSVVRENGRLRVHSMYAK